MYAVLSGINTLIVRVRQRDELFREACRIAVEHGQFKIAWIGRVDHDLQEVVPVALAGAGAEFLMHVRRRLWLSETPREGESLSASVVRTRQSVVCEDIQNDPRILVPQELAARGVASMAVLPLLVAHEVVGVIALFADEAGFFDDDEMHLLTCLLYTSPSPRD